MGGGKAAATKSEELAAAGGVWRGRQRRGMIMWEK